MVDGLKLGLFFPFSLSLSSCEPHLDVLLITLSLAEANLVEKKVIFSFSRFPLFSTKGKKENEIKWVVFTSKRRNFKGRETIQVEKRKRKCKPNSTLIFFLRKNPYFPCICLSLPLSLSVFQLLVSSILFYYCCKK